MRRKAKTAAARGRLDALSMRGGVTMANPFASTCASIRKKEGFPPDDPFVSIPRKNVIRERGEKVSIGCPIILQKKNSVEKDDLLH